MTPSKDNLKPKKITHDTTAKQKGVDNICTPIITASQIEEELVNDKTKFEL